MANALYYLNLVIAALASFAAFGMLNKQSWGKTRPCIIGATLLIALGLAGQWLGLAKEVWVLYADTALYGGTLAMLLATQRTHTWFLERWANPIASGIVMVVGGVFLAGLLGGCATPAPKPHCERYLYSVFENADGHQFMVLDAENSHRLAALIAGLAEGTCVLPPAKGTGT